MNYEDIKVSSLIINDMSKDAYEREKAAGNVYDNELYLVDDNGNFELLNDVVLEADKVISFAKDDAGMPYKLNELVVKIDNPISAEAKPVIDIVAFSTGKGLLYFNLNDGINFWQEKPIAIHLYKNKGKWISECFATQYGATLMYDHVYKIGTAKYMELDVSAFPYVTSVLSYKKYKAGTKIKVYGVKV